MKLKENLKIIGKLKEKKAGWYILRLLAAFVSSVLFAAAFAQDMFTQKEFYSAINFPLFIVSSIALFILFCFIKKDKYVLLLLIGLSQIYCMFTAVQIRNYMFSFGLCAVMFIIVFFFDFPFDTSASLGRLKWIMCALLIGLYTLYVGGLCCVYYRTYRTPCFDFGLFAQMFYYMKETGRCLITCERDKLLSHFAVHFSPIYYLLLPLYFILPSPCTLLVSQAFIVASAAIPLMLLCRHFKLSDTAALIFVSLLILYPSFMGGCFWYLHENCFLTPLLLWLMYFFEKDRFGFIAAFALLTLFVKEDAAVYVAVVSLYYIFAKKNYKCSATVFLFSVVYFVVVTKCMNAFGEGIMSNSRYGNYIYDGGGLFSVIKAVLQNPAYAVLQIFTQEKLIFMLQMLVGLSFLPFAVKKPSKLLLFIPLVLVNLMTSYSYQFDIGFQYTFGSGALLFYLAVSNYSDLGENRNKLLCSAVLSSLILFSGGYLKKTSALFEAENNRQTAEIIDEALALIPDDASVLASTFLLANVSQRKELYEIERTSHRAEYIAGDLRNGRVFPMEEYLNEGYEIIFYEEGIVAVLMFDP
ncbi:MAG: DUF2079 domain-containing protein [Oscillospiraceae bacterium]|nr:DUF2079 domain-containing protein [Oscillospiraceae bacterium]